MLPLAAPGKFDRWTKLQAPVLPGGKMPGFESVQRRWNRAKPAESEQPPTSTLVVLVTCLCHWVETLDDRAAPVVVTHGVYLAILMT